MFCLKVALLDRGVHLADGGESGASNTDNASASGLDRQAQLGP